MDEVHHAEMTHLVRREKKAERRLRELRDQFGTWRERLELAESADRRELVEKAAQKIQELRREGRDLRSELKALSTKKKNLRVDSRRPTGEETRRAEALLRSFEESGLIDPEEAGLDREFDELGDPDAEAALDALKAKAGMEVEPDSPQKRSPETEENDATEQPEDDLDAELEELREEAGMEPDSPSGDDGADEPDDELDAELEELRKELEDE